MKQCQSMQGANVTFPSREVCSVVSAIYLKLGSHLHVLLIVPKQLFQKLSCASFGPPVAVHGSSEWSRLGPLMTIINSCSVLSSFMFLLALKWFSKIDTRDSSTDSQDTLTQHTLIACITISISVKRARLGSKNCLRMSLGSAARSSSRGYGFVNS